MKLREVPAVLDEPHDAERLAGAERGSLSEVAIVEPVVDVHDQGHGAQVADRRRSPTPRVVTSPLRLGLVEPVEVMEKPMEQGGEQDARRDK
jgi:hypothetical protein